MYDTSNILYCMCVMYIVNICGLYPGYNDVYVLMDKSIMMFMY